MNHRPDNKSHRFSLSSTVLRPILLSLLLAASSAGFSTEVQPRIIGGFPSKDADWPWMTAILLRNVSNTYLAQFCGGSLIHPYWVMTAAHCVFDDFGNPLPPDFLDVLVGEIDLFASGERIPVVRVIPHPSYTSAHIYNDIALLQLEKPSTEQPVQLPGPTFPAGFHNPVVPPGTVATVLGWGNMSTEGEIWPNLLQEVDVPIVDLATCQEAYSGLADIVESQVCAGFADGGKDACQGDSGGPLVAQSPATGNKLVQVGVTSLGKDCAQPDFYGIYTRVSSFSQWISGICSAAETPAAPVIKLSLSGNLASLKFAPVSGATGYRLFWAPYPSMKPVSQLDIGTTTSFSARLPSGTRLWVAVEAYNGNCLGPFSDLKSLLVP